MGRTVVGLNLIRDLSSVSVKGKWLHCVKGEAVSFAVWAGMTSEAQEAAHCIDWRKCWNKLMSILAYF